MASNAPAKSSPSNSPELISCAVLAVGVLPRGRGFIARAGAHDRFDRQVVLGGELEITLVVCRHGHDRAVAVMHQHIVGDPHRQFLAGQRVLDEQAGRQAFLFLSGDVGFGDAAALAFGDERLQLGIVLRSQGGQRVLGGNGDVGRAHQGVRTGGEDFQGAGFADGRLTSYGNCTSMPRDLPIQLRCMVLTCSGQPGSSSRLSSSSSA